MIKFSMDVIQTRSKTVEIVAKDEGEALLIVGQMYDDDDIDFSENEPSVEFDIYDEEDMEVQDEKDHKNGLYGDSL